MESIALFSKLIIIALASLTIVHYSGIVGQLKVWLHTRFQIPFHQLKLKPLDCHICLSFWLSVLYFVAEVTEKRPVTLQSVVVITVYGLATSAISHFLYKIFK